MKISTQRGLTRQAEQQLGLITRPQLTELHLSERTIAGMADRHHLVQLCEDVVIRTVRSALGAVAAAA